MNNTSRLSFVWGGDSVPAGAARVAFAFGDRILAAGPDADRAAAWRAKADWPGTPASATWLPGGAPLLLVGLGPDTEFSPTRFYRACAAAGRSLAAAKWLDAAALDTAALDPLPLDAAARVSLAVAGLAFGAYSFSAKSKPSTDASLAVTLCGVPAAEPAFRDAVAQAAILADVRDLANQPANTRTTRETAEAFATLADAHGLSTRIWGPEELAAAGCNALLSVGKGSHEGACLLRAEWNGTGDPAAAPLALVGKAIIFDAGGICLKPSKNMEWMQYDKCGALAVLAAALLAAGRKSPHRVVAWIPMAKNLPGGGASVPGDIVTARNGKTVEILNTDAEGRLILADALALAAEEKPAAIVDAATLTGAVVIALGHEAAAVLGSSEPLVRELLDAGAATGERLWELPLWPDYAPALKGRFADLKNMGDGTAGTIAGASFLRAFVPDAVPWAHLDIAGTAWTESTSSSWAPIGATLFGARLLAEWIARR
jgi:leucyl aminopeptidase